jgi:hypothetical protein
MDYRCGSSLEHPRESTFRGVRAVRKPRGADNFGWTAPLNRFSFHCQGWGWLNLPPDLSHGSMRPFRSPRPGPSNLLICTR